MSLTVHTSMPLEHVIQNNNSASQIFETRLNPKAIDELKAGRVPDLRDGNMAMPPFSNLEQSLMETQMANPEINNTAITNILREESFSSLFVHTNGAQNNKVSEFVSYLPGSAMIGSALGTAIAVYLKMPLEQVLHAGSLALLFGVSALAIAVTDGIRYIERGLSYKNNLKTNVKIATMLDALQHRP